MHTQLLVSTSLLVWCSQAARDEADESGEALHKLGGLLKKYAASAHPSLEAETAQAGETTELAHRRASRAHRDPGLNMTVGQTVTLHHDGTGTTGRSSRVVSSGRDSQGHAIITNQSSHRIGGNEPPNIATESESGRPKLKRSNSIPPRFQNRSEKGAIDPDEDLEELPTQAWNPDAMCGDIVAQTLMEQYRQAEGLSEFKAKNKTMARCPRKFLSWNGNKIIETRFHLQAITKQEQLRKKGMTADAARQIIMAQYPEKFNRGGTACAWVVDGGSTGGRLYQFTEQEFCPTPERVDLVCESGADTNNMIAFSLKNSSKGKVLRFRDVIGAKAEVLPRDLPEWLRDTPLLSSASKIDEFVMCYAHSLAKKVGEKEDACSRSTLYIGVTAGFRDYQENVSNTEDKDARSAKIKNAVSYFNLALKFQLVKNAPRTKLLLGGLQTLSIQREGSMEASATQAVAQASGNSIAQNAIGVFSMGGKSAQFTSFKGDRATLNLKMGHLVGIKIIDEAAKEGISDVGAMRERMGQRLKELLDKAKEEDNAPGEHEFEDFITGQWIGISGTAFAAKDIGILKQYDPENDFSEKMPKEASREDVQKALDEHLEKRTFSEWCQTKENKRSFSQALILDFWMKNVFTDKSSFYFRKNWDSGTNEHNGRCLLAEWPFAAAQDSQPLVKMALQDLSDAESGSL